MGHSETWSLLNMTGDVVLSITTKGQIEYVNRAWTEALGYSEDEARGLKLDQIIFPGYLRKFKTHIDSVLAGKSLKNIEVVLISRNGEQVVLEGSMFPRVEDGNVVACVCMFRDVSETKRILSRLQEEQSKAEFFVDLMVHDLTNIHQEIMSSLEVILYDESTPPALADMTRETIAEVERASRIVSNVRKLTRLSRPAPVSITYDLCKVIEESAKTVAREFKDKKMILKTNLKPGQYHLTADEFLPDVFKALLHNSMKFDDSSEVEIEVQVDPIPKTPFLRIQVMDHGRGIPDEEKESIFDLLSHRRDSLLGLGLGLTLVRRILNNYGAFIRVEDRIPNQHTAGANFVILMRYDTGAKLREEEV